MRLYIDSGIHVSRDVQQRIEGIEENIGEPEFVFYEGDSSAFSIEAAKTFLKAFPFAPLLTAAFGVQVYLLVEGLGRILSNFGGESSGSDQDIVDTLKEKYGIESQEVDVDLSQFIHEHRIASLIVNWTAFAAVLAYHWPIQMGLLQILALIVSWLTVGYVLMIVFLALVHEARNRYFAEEIASSKQCFDDTCLVTGGAHHTGVGKILENEDGVTVLNPEPEDLLVMTRTVLAIFGAINKGKSLIETIIRRIQKGFYVLTISTLWSWISPE